jgi:large subunit ribosomal protein L25
MEITLTAETGRPAGSRRSGRLRADGQVPGVVYGLGSDPVSVTVSWPDLRKALVTEAGLNALITLDYDGHQDLTVVKELQRHPVRRNVLHVDFQELVAGERMVVRIPIVLQGIPEGVRTSGGILSQILQELECRVDPLNMPGKIDVDVTHITIGHSVHVSEITAPEGVEILDDPESTICVVAAPKEEVEVPAAGATPETPAEPELIRKPKEGEEGEPEET